ncbi:MAG: WD40 repeat domain-containing protein, partial [Candidatus Eremiobacterota bacterium]
DGHLTAWDPILGERQARFAADSAILWASFSPDGRQLVFVSRDGLLEARLRPQPFPVVRRTLAGPATGVAFHPDSHRLAVALETGGLELLSVDGLKSLRSLPAPVPLSEVAFSPDGHYVRAHAAPLEAPRAWVWEVDSGKLAWEGAAESADFSREGTLLAVECGEGPVILVNLGSGQVREVPGLSSRDVHCLRLSPDGSSLALAGQLAPGWEGFVEVRRVDGSPAFPRWKLPELVTALAFSPDGSLLASGTCEGRLDLWDVEQGGSVAAPMLHSGALTALKGGQGLFLSAAVDGTLRGWSPSGALLFRPLAHPDAVHRASATKDGRTVASLSGRRFRLWETWCGRPLSPWLRSRGQVQSLALSPDGSFLAVVGDEVELWSLAPDRSTGLVDSVEAASGLELDPETGLVRETREGW